MSKIKDIFAREILDSRGNPTIETEIILENNVKSIAAVPSGASTGIHEALELRDDDKNRYGGKGVLKAVDNVNIIIKKKLIGIEVSEQEKIDQIMIDLDGTKNKTKLGANAILSVSLACARTAAKDQGLELFEYIRKTYKFPKIEVDKFPVPLFNIFNGGRHADTNLDFQEFLFIPKRQSVAKMVQEGAEVFHELGKVLEESDYDTDVGAEGGYAPNLDSTIDAIEFIIAAAIRAGYKPGKDFRLGTDVGSAGLFNIETKKYLFSLDGSYLSSEDLISLYRSWLEKYHFYYLEDGLSEDEWDEWSKLRKELGEHMLIVGDDLYVTNVDRLRIGLKKKAANAIIIKPNQVGTLSETIECVKLAQNHNYKIIVSHRSGETIDSFIADLAVAIGADYLKAGSLSRGERLAKYNRLMEIELMFKK